ncbi:MAG: NAD(+)/NADH kinase [Clostridia bacterium]|nr:NAD(+)/NADH kinase [Clostridia bacterium]
MNSVLYVLNTKKPAVYSSVNECALLCMQRGISISFLKEDEESLAANLPNILNQCGIIRRPAYGQFDAIFVFGGDGTMLHALDAFVECDIPMLGINLGRMGFLLETEVTDLEETIDKLLSGAYVIERRMMLKVEGYCSGTRIDAYATNDVAVSRGLSQRMIAVDAFVGDILVDHYIADGVVLASPTGSTGYSLSAGGPIVSPDVQCFILNPICPHTLTSRPIVLSSDACVRLKLNMNEMREGVQLSIDGQSVCTMANYEEIRIRRSSHDAMLIRFPKERNYFSLLKSKLSQWTL